MKPQTSDVRKEKLVATPALDPLAQYFLDEAIRRKGQGWSEVQFMDDLDLSTLAQTPDRSTSYGEAYSRAASSQDWPWDTSSPAT